MPVGSGRIRFPEPRPFQSATRIKLRERIKAGQRKLVVCAPTGSGKTMLAMYLTHETLQNKKTAMFVADRIALIDQTADTALRHGLTEFGIIQAKHPRTDPNQPFQIASAQTLALRRVAPTDLLLIDECHTFHRGWMDLIADFPGVVIGLTATPFTRGMGNIFDGVINATTMADLVADGTLVRMRVFVAAQPDMRDAATTGGEWTDRAAEERGLKIVGDVVVEWRRYASDRKTICFGATIKHCEEICRRFNDAGIMAAVFCADTPDDERRRLLEEYRKPDSVLRVLISVEALAKGFDVADVGCVIDARPLRKSFSTYVQMVGRGARCYPGKSDFIVLDCSGNSVRFAADYSNLFYNGIDSLDDAELLDKKVRNDDPDDGPGEAHACPGCGYTPFAKRCIACGFTVKSKAMIEHVTGSLTEQEVMIRGKRLADSHRDLFNQCMSHARNTSAPDKQFWRAKLLYRDMVGMLPPDAWTPANTPQVEVSPDTVNRIKYLRIRAAHSKAKGNK